jgi:hypothetical protein
MGMCGRLLTFVRKSDADRCLRLIESRMSQGDWSDPKRARVLVDDYATLWIAQLTADTRNCPETAMKLPGGGHENCPLTDMRSARHDSVCLAASRG